MPTLNDSNLRSWFDAPIKAPRTEQKQQHTPTTITATTKDQWSFGC